MTRLSLASGTELGAQYTIVREIGRGGMATVYLANDRKHDRHVAIKVLHSEFAAAIGADRFAREIRTVGRLQHPNVLPLFDSGEHEGQLYFVMPFIEGESLRDRLDREGSLSLGDATLIIRQIGAALDYSHSRGVVHRDVKPENILLTGDRALLSDYGVARGVREEDLQTLTSAGTTLGTPYYMSPEQSSAERDIDGRSDLYSIGCITHEMLSGERPFVGANPMATMAQHIAKQPPRLVGARDTVSEEIADAVARMLSKDPADRFQTAAAFAAILGGNVEETRRISAETDPLRAERATTGKSTVFVLDFTNITKAPDIDWLSGGIAETVGIDLRRVGGIQLVGSDAATRQRVHAAKSAGTIDANTARQMGRAVGARWVVWGAYQKSGTRIRLTPQFTEVETGKVVSADKIDGQLDDIFELQDRIVTRLTEILRIELTTDESILIAKRETSTLSAYELYARGRQAFLVFGKASAQIAYDSFSRAVAIDPGYALAWAGLGSLLMPRYIASGNRDHLDEGVKALRRALELDPTLGEPHLFLAYMYVQLHRYDEAVNAARTAVDRDPGASFGWYMLGIALLSRGIGMCALQDLPRAVRPLLRSRSINPNFHPAHIVMGWLYLYRGDREHASLLIDEAIAVERSGVGQQFLGSFVLRGTLHLYGGEMEQAREWIELALRTYAPVDHVYAEMVVAWSHFQMGRIQEHEGDYAGAEASYGRAIDVAEQHDHRLAIGSAWVKATAGRARIAFRQSDFVTAAKLLDDALNMLVSKHRFVWINFPGCADGESWYEIAATRATLGDDTGAISALQRAMAHGWANVPQLDHDACLLALAANGTVRQALADSVRAFTLPEPFGSGGLPDFSS